MSLDKKEGQLVTKCSSNKGEDKTAFVLYVFNILTSGPFTYTIKS